MDPDFHPSKYINYNIYFYNIKIFIQKTQEKALDPDFHPSKCIYYILINIIHWDENLDPENQSFKNQRKSWVCYLGF